MARRSLGAVLILFLQLTFVMSVRGQSDRATVTGVVSDPSGAAIAGVAVTAISVQTGVQTKTVTNETGRYNIPNLPIGDYTIQFEARGFAKLVRSGITLSVTQVAEINVTLKMGAVKEVVEVTAAAPLLQTETTDVGATMSHSAIQDIPLNLSTNQGRELEQFAYQVTPGVEGGVWTSNIAGTPAFTKQVLIDGTMQQGSESGGVSEDYPPMDAVEEFKVDSGGTMGQQSANSAGGVFMFSLKSGTNQFHGSVYGSMQNEALNANTWGHPGRTPLDRMQDYALSGGGPIIKNKTFFFAAFEQYRFTDFVDVGTPSTVPTTAFLNGDFSALLTSTPVGANDACGNTIYKGAIIDPTTGCYFTYNGKLNVIDPARFSSVSKQIIGIYQQYYQPANAALTDNAIFPNYNTPWFHQTQFSIKVDHNISSTDKLASSFIYTDRPRMLINNGASGGIWSNTGSSGGPLAQSRLQDVGSRSFRLSESHTFSPTLLNVSSFTYLRFTIPSHPYAASGDWPQKLGFGNTGAGNFPQISFGGSVNGIGENPIGFNNNSFSLTNIFVGDDTVTWTKGRHTFSFGGEVRGFQMNSHSLPGALSFNFSNAQTGAPTTSYASQVGFGFASFLLGDVQSASEGTAFDLYGRRKELNLYSSDSFKVNSKLTLSLGLNWAQTYGWKEKYGHWGNFNLTEMSQTFGIPGTTDYATPGTSFEGPIQWKDFAPRVGAAYKITKRIVARGAYGLSYVPIGENFWEGVPYGFAPGYQAVNLVPKTTSYAPAFDWDRGYPGVPVQGTPGNKDYLTWGMVSVSPKSLVPGRIQQFNAGVEIEAMHDVRVSLGYLGNRGTHLHDGELLANQPTNAALSALLKSGNEWDWVSDPASAKAAGVPYPYAGFSGEAAFCIAPFPQVANTWGPLYGVGAPLGSSQYDSFQAEVLTHSRHGLTENLSYNFSHQRTNIDTSYGNFQETWNSVASIQDINNPSYSENYIQPWNQSIFKGYVLYELPFGRGRAFLGSSSRRMDALVGGWSLASTLYYGTGAPLGVYSINSPYLSGEGTGQESVYSNVAPGADLSRHFSRGRFNSTNPLDPGNLYFEPSGFSSPAYGDFGNSGPWVSRLHGFGNAEEDFSITKNFAITERVHALIRAEFFDVFNRHYFTNPVTNLGSPYFGYVLSVGSSGTSGVAARQGQLDLRVSW